MESRWERREEQKRYFREDLESILCSIMKDKHLWFAEEMAFKFEENEAWAENEKETYLQIIQPALREGIPNFPMLYLVVHCSPSMQVLVMERSDTDFQQTIHEEGRSMTPEMLHDYLFQIFTTHYYLLTKGVIHGDLKPNNVLVDRREKFRGCFNYFPVYETDVYVPFHQRLLKLGDFGLSRKITPRDDLTCDYRRFLSLLRREITVYNHTHLEETVDVFRAGLEEYRKVYEKVSIEMLRKYLEGLKKEVYDNPSLCEIVLR